MRYLTFLLLALVACSTLTTAAFVGGGAALGAAIGGPPGAFAGGLAGWGTAEAIDNAKIVATLTGKALETGNVPWWEAVLDAISPLVFVGLLLFWFAPAPQDIVRHIKKKKREHLPRDRSRLQQPWPSSDEEGRG